MSLSVFLPLLLASSSFAAQPNAPLPKAAPLRELPWAQLNFLHTTDTHGWLGGHLQESSYSADWGDYVSFAKHMRDKADADGVDLLLIDTGDRVEGNGLYDGSEPKGRYLFDIFKQQEIDVVCSGNHELYKQNSSENEFHYTVPNFEGSYLASNLDIFNPDTGDLEALAPRFKKFTTKNQGIRILAFGFLFNFVGNANNTVVYPVEDTIKKKWFQEAIHDKDVDLILVTGHVPTRATEYDHIFKAIRSVNWDIPIQFFAGHAHVRDYKVFDSKAVAMASGRYMETIGFMSIKGLGNGKPKDDITHSGISFSRRYIDNNLFSYYHHSNKDGDTFPTPHGQNVSKMITAARDALQLDKRHGCAPQPLWVNRAPYPANDSIFSWLQEHVLPVQLKNSSRIMKEDKKALVIANTGAMRFDIFQGPFTKDSAFLVSPFTSGFRYLKDVPYSAAKHVLSLLNNEDRVLQTTSGETLDSAVLSPPEQWSGRIGDSLSGLNSHNRFQAPLNVYPHKSSDLIPGYTTIDDDGDDGDDTVHSQIQFFDVPNCIQTTLGFAPDDENVPEEVDLVYNEFVQPWLLVALRYLGQEYNTADTQAYMEGKSFTDMITDWISEHWDC
ncbi:uncharacterized protein K452DRAFT_232787 [Aplosporella prunicola CBS 121167]|uniref:Uncharacterized protein n=1 Tax=Aplosporella prunicola CBS 121167 TaxID=1176127 RepID=A0A6A6B623_9PEZI|nr:uncharacterized protein K452DRAFT_232787 [Aplosporella prunicola CBS 121167]KAF2139316.1 hypothetical protein K452DRAFT_232787 [Aplosporella prunicola CBS 121167]